jgi:hypothetical protein
MEVDHKWPYKLCLKYCLQVNKCKYDDNAKLWGYVWQFQYRICTTTVAAANDNGTDDDDDEVVSVPN